MFSIINNKIEISQSLISSSTTSSYSNETSIVLLQNKHTDKWTQMEDTDMNPYSNGYLIL